MATRTPRIGKSTVKMPTPKKGEELTPEEKEFYRFLHRVVDDIFQIAKDEYQLTWNQLAGRAGVGYMTVYFLGERITRFPGLRTVYKLARAVGKQFELVDTKTKKGTIKLPKLRKAG